MTQVQKELAKTRGQFEALQAELVKGTKGADGIVDVKKLNDVNSKLANYRNQLLATLEASGQYNVQSVKMLSHSEAFTQDLMRQKIGLKDVIANRKMLNDVYREQLKLQQAQLVYSKSDGRGMLDTSMAIPTKLGDGIDTLTKKLGFYNQVMGSVADQTVKWGKNTQWAGRQLMTGFTMPIVATAAATGALAYKMEQGIAGVVKVYGDATTQLTTSNADIRNMAIGTSKTLASTYGQSAKDTLDIMQQLAANGETGVALQEATAQVTRARLLGDLDLNDAMKATITLQNAYNMSGQELADTFNYMNTMENQTALTMQDFVVGIPKVSGIMKALGVSVQDTGVLLAGMKVAGIDAAEGATAIKSAAFKAFNPSKDGLDTFLKLTNQDLGALIKSADGQLIPLLQKVSVAMKGLDKDSRIKVVGDLFGIHQGSKIFALMDQLTSGSEQMTRAFDIASQSAGEWSDTAARELQVLQESAPQKLKKAWASLTTELATTGEVFLPMVAGIVKGVGDLVKSFNGMSKAKKQFILVGAVAFALIGPIIMLIGLFANLFGNMMKFGVVLNGLFLKFRVHDEAQRAAILAQKQASSGFYAEATAANALSTAIKNLTKNMAVLEAEKRGVVYQGAFDSPIGPTGPTKPWNRKGTQGFLPASAHPANREGVGKVAGMNEEQAAANFKKIEESSAKTSRNWGRTATSVSGLAFGVTAAASMVTSSNQMLNNMLQISMIASLIGPTIVKGLMKAEAVNSFFTGVATRAKTIGSAINSFVGGAFTRAGAAIGSMLPMLGLVGGAVVALGVVASRSIKKVNEEITQASNSAKDWADILGYTYVGIGESVDKSGEKILDFNGKVEKFRTTNEGAAKEFERIAAIQASATDAASISQDKLNRAIQEGIKVRMHGGSVQAAEEAAAAALQLMGEKFSEAQLKAAVHVEFDFGDMAEVARRATTALGEAMGKAVNDTNEGASKWDIAGAFINRGLTSAAKTKIKNQVDETWKVYKDANVVDRARIFSEISKGINQESDKLFEDMSKKHSKEFKNLGINNAEDMRKYFQNGGTPVNLGIMGGDAARTQKVMEGLKTSIQEILLLENAQSPGLDNILNPRDIEKAVGATKGAEQGLTSLAEAQSYYAAAVESAARNGKPYNEEQKLAILNIWRHAAGLEAATNSEQGFAGSMEEATTAAGDNATAIQRLHAATTAYFGDNFDWAGKAQEIKKAGMDTIFGAAADIADAQLAATSDSIANRYDAQRAKMDRSKEKWDAKWEAADEAMQKAQEARTKKTSDAWDKRIQAVQNAIDAEKKAEDIRQKIFEAEKTRISRLADMFNKNVDFNAALNSGNLDTAAKVANDMSATQQSWNVGDAADASKNASQARVDALSAKKDALDKQKAAALQNLKDIDDAEKKAAADKKKREQKALDDKLKRLDKEQKAEEKAAKAGADARKRALDQSLAAIRAFTPRNQAEVNQQIAKIEAAYQKYGVNLNAKGSQWSTIIGTAMGDAAKQSARVMNNDIKWAAIGQKAAQDMIAGAFGMNLTDFLKWISTGEMPKAAGPSKVVHAKGKNYAVITSGPAKGHHVPLPSSLHTGGIVGLSKGGRVGYSASQGKAPSEVDTRLLTGEAVLNRKATSVLGTDFINNVNKGKATGIGGADNSVGIMGSIMAGAVAGIKGAMMAAIMAAALTKADAGAMGDYSAAAGKAGKYGGNVFDAAQMANAATIASVGKSMGGSSRDIIIALMTAMQESGLRNLNYGDRDSLGLFQQRAPWGTVAARTDPATAARMFFGGGSTGQRGLFDFKNRNSMSLAEAAQAVQVSAFPGAYAKWQDEAEAIFRSLSFTGSSAGAVGNGAFARPVPGRITSEYGMRVNPVTGQYKLHDGIDFGSPMGTPIRAAMAGRVLSAGWANGYGNYTVIQSGDTTFGYGHQSRIGVRAGQNVAKGQFIGNVGSTGNSTGPHLHLLTHRNGVSINPRQILPGLATGGFTLNDGYAKLHKSEAVLTKPLTAKLQDGINNLDESTHAQYNVNVNFNGPVNTDLDFQGGVEKAIENVQRRKGVNRKVGGK